MSQSSRDENGAKQASNTGEQIETVDSQIVVGEAGANKSIVGEEAVNSHQLQTPISFNVIAAPKVCPPGYQMDATGKCRKII